MFIETAWQKVDVNQFSTSNSSKGMQKVKIFKHVLIFKQIEVKAPYRWTSNNMNSNSLSVGRIHLWVRKLKWYFFKTSEY